MSGGETAPENDGPSDEGPIILPADACCKNCHYSVVIRMDPKAIHGTRICRRYPPGPYFIPNNQGGMLVSSPPPVPDDYACFEYDAKETPAIIPTGLG